jgi:CRP-like cAMP-binding protein
MSHHLQNQLLARLSPVTLAALEPDLTVAQLERGHVISETQTAVNRVFFPHGGIISCVVNLTDGGIIETGMIGKDGQFGAGAALDHKLSLNYVVMQVAGDASIITSDRFRQLAQEHPSLREIAVCYEQFFLAQAQQTAACNAVHDVQTRTCKWLLRMQRLVGDDIPLTQEFLAQMMGVGRSSVSPVASQLQRDGLIHYSRGRIHILDLVKIKKAACECDDAVNSNYDLIFEI